MTTSYSSMAFTQSNPHDHVSLAWADGAILSTACTTAKVDVQLEEGWRRAALRTALPPGLAELKITRAASTRML